MSHKDYIPEEAKITMLSGETVDKIAAGEVILSPVSVVKELVENAADAGAKKIKIEIEKGGKERIRVTDNGCGIRYNEVGLAFQRHATSKIRFANDLEALLTMGFRGEALSSIAAVAEVEILTRHHDEEVGSRTTLQNGEIVNHAVAAWDRGTQIDVRGLFEGVPARRKYMKKDDEEETKIRRMCEKLALSRIDIAFTLIINGKRVFATPGNGAMRDCLSALFGPAVSKSFLPIHEENTPMKIRGVIGDLSLRRTSRNLQLFFVNNRPVELPAFRKAYEEVWQGKLMQHQFPAGIFFIDLPPKMLDVNIHPQKTQIRILNESLAVLLFRQGIRDAMGKLNLTLSPVKEDVQTSEPEKVSEETNHSEEKHEDEILNLVEDILKSPPKEEVFVEKPKKLPDLTEQLDLFSEPAEQDAPWMRKYFPDLYDKTQENPDMDEETTAVRETADQDLDYSEKIQEKALEDVASDQETDDEAQEKNQSILSLYPKEARQERPNFHLMRYVGSLFHTYILLEDAAQVYLFDQHAAHEAILFDEFKKVFLREQSFPQQGMLLTRQIALRPDEMEIFERYQQELKNFGFDAEVFSEDSIAVRAVPVILGEAMEPEMIYTLLELYESKTPTQQGLNKVITMACKKAVKAGEVLTESEVRTLLRDLQKIDNPYTCPHGRPIILKLSEYELRKLFKRIV